MGHIFNLTEWSDRMTYARTALMRAYDEMETMVTKREIPYFRAEKEALNNLENVERYLAGWKWMYCDHVRKGDRLVRCRAYLSESGDRLPHEELMVAENQLDLFDSDRD